MFKILEHLNDFGPGIFYCLGVPGIFYHFCFILNQNSCGNCGNHDQTPHSVGSALFAD